MPKPGLLNKVAAFLLLLSPFREDISASKSTTSPCDGKKIAGTGGRGGGKGARSVNPIKHKEGFRTVVESLVLITHLHFTNFLEIG